jgi:hypothetical protein
MHDLCCTTVHSHKDARSAGMAITAVFALTSVAAYGAKIVVNSLDDPGVAGICALRDVITAANTMLPLARKAQ